MGWFKKFGKSDWWLGENSWFAQGLETAGKSGLKFGDISFNQQTNMNDPVSVGVQHDIDPRILYGVGGLVLLKVLKVI
jgi:hypothetical protein